MTRIPLTNRFAIVCLALIYTVLTFGAATSSPAFAAEGPYYRAELAQPAKEARFVASGVVWNCDGNVCVAAKGRARPERTCRGLARKLGPVASFTAEGEALAEDKLATCNR